MQVDVIAPCPPTDGAAVLSIDTDSISHSANRATERSPFQSGPLSFAAIDALQFRGLESNQRPPRSERGVTTNSNYPGVVDSGRRIRTSTT